MHKERGGTETSAIHEAELTKVEQALTLLRQRQNQVTCGNKAKEKALKILEDELKDLQRSSSRPAHEANPLMRQIRTLENRLDKAMIKYNEAQSIRKTYDQIVKRLKEERVNFDNQVRATALRAAALARWCPFVLVERGRRVTAVASPD
jgi:chromosome segregation ATPase